MIIIDSTNVHGEIEYYVVERNGTVVAGPFPLPQDAKMALLEMEGKTGSAYAEPVIQNGRLFWK